MDFNRLTEKSQEAIRQAQTTATNYGNQQVEVEHLLLAMLEQEGGLAPSILLRADVPLEALHQRLIQEIEKLPENKRLWSASGSGLHHAPSFAAFDPCRRTSQAPEGRLRLD